MLKQSAGLHLLPLHIAQGQTFHLSHRAALSLLQFFILPGLSAMEIPACSVFHWFHLWLWGRPGDKSKLMMHCDCESARHKSNTWCETVRCPEVHNWNCFQLQTLTGILFGKKHQLARKGIEKQSVLILIHFSCQLELFLNNLPHRRVRKHKHFYFSYSNQVHRNNRM